MFIFFICIKFRFFILINKMSENGNDSNKISIDSMEDDPFEDLLTQDKQRDNGENSQNILLVSPSKTRRANSKIEEFQFDEPEIIRDSNYKYDYGYNITLTFLNEDGLIDTYLNGWLLF
jgi:hypothetical protein